MEFGKDSFFGIPKKQIPRYGDLAHRDGYVYHLFLGSSPWEDIERLGAWTSWSESRVDAFAKSLIGNWYTVGESFYAQIIQRIIE